MKKLGMALLTSMILANAAYVEAGSMVTQRGNTDIFYVWTDETGTDIEFQRVVDYQGKDKTFLRIMSTDKDFTNVKLIPMSTGKEIPLEEISVEHDFKLPANQYYKWYKFNREDWVDLPRDKDGNGKIKLIMTGVDGKSYERVKELDLRNLVTFSTYTQDKLKKAKEIYMLLPSARAGLHGYGTTYYQPMFTMFFPNQTYKQLKERFCYNLNEHDSKSQKIKLGLGYINRYTQDDERQRIGFKTIDRPGGYEDRNYIYFQEADGGVYLNYDKDYDIYHGTTVNGRYGPIDLYTGVYNISEMNAHTFETINTTYTQLYGWKDYGFYVFGKYNYNFNKFKDLNVTDPALQGELGLDEKTAKKNDYRITAVNGIETKYMNALWYDMLTEYNAGLEPIEFEFTSKKLNIVKTIKRIPVRKELGEWANPKLDFEAVNNMPYNYSWIMKKRVPEDFLERHHYNYSIFDPTTPSNIPIRDVYRENFEQNIRKEQDIRKRLAH